MRHRILARIAVAIVAAVAVVAAVGPFALAGGFQPVAGGDCTGNKCK
jgi:hypothetical protein